MSIMDMGEEQITHEYLIKHGWSTISKMISMGKTFTYYSRLVGVHNIGIMELMFIPPWETRFITTTHGVFEINGHILTEYEFKGLPGYCYKLKEYANDEPITTILELEATLKHIIKSYNS